MSSAPYVPNNSPTRRPAPDGQRSLVGKNVPTYRLWAIVSIPFGLVFGAIALMISLNVDILKDRGEFAEARIKSGKVKTLCIIGNVLTVLFFPALIFIAEIAIRSAK